MEARITEIFSSILQGIDSEELSRLVDAAISAGIRAESDLKYLAHDDICNVLPPIQVRKLLQHLSSPCTEQPAMTGLGAVQATVSADSILATTSMETVNSGSNSNWVNAFKIPWAKCPDSLLMSIDQGQQPSARDLRQLITHTMSDICCITRRASRQDLRSVARKIVDRSPSAFADVVNGEVIADGIGSIMLMLESKKENMNRSSVSSDAFSTSKRKASASRQYGCSTWEPSFPPNETGDSLEKSRVHMVALFSTQPDSPEADTLMSSTFCLQRQMINSGMSVNDILQKWPFLGTSVQLTNHFLKLTNVDIAVRLHSAVEVKAAMLYEFFSSERQTNIELKCAVDKIGAIAIESHQHLHNGLLLLLMAYFRESTSSIISFQQDISDVAKVDVVSLPTYPVIIGFGKDVFSCKNYLVSVQRKIFDGHAGTSDFLAALAVMFSCYYVFNLEYNPSCVATLEFMQRDLVGINPADGSKSSKGRKKGVPVCPRVTTLFRKLSSFQRNRITATNTSAVQQPPTTGIELGCSISTVDLQPSPSATNTSAVCQPPTTGVEPGCSLSSVGVQPSASATNRRQSGAKTSAITVPLSATDRIQSAVAAAAAGNTLPATRVTKQERASRLPSVTASSKKNRKKKLTCRLDKRRGRRPKMKVDDIHVCCSGCGEEYIHSTDEWLQCSMPRCKLWYELSCTGLQGLSRAKQNKFVCEQCK